MAVGIENLQRSAAVPSSPLEEVGSPGTFSGALVPTPGGDVWADGVIDDGDDSFALPMWASYMVIAVLIMLSGLFSGLTLGLLSLDMNGLKIIIESNDAKEAALARTIEPIRKNGNLFQGNYYMKAQSNYIIRTRLNLIAFWWYGTSLA